MADQSASPSPRVHAYRPYPAPTSPWVMHQSWHDLCFMHWPVPVESLRPHIPPGLQIDTFDGQAWIAVVPFRMSRVYPRGLFPVPGLSAFPELNVRTYVIRDGKPGVWFFSLDAGNRLAVALARTGFMLPYFHARMSLSPPPVAQRTAAAWFDGIHYVSERIHPNAPPAELVAQYRPLQAPFEATPGSLEYFLTARYCLYTADKRGAIYRAEIDHPPWPLQLAEAEIERNTMTDWIPVALPATRPLLHFARRLDVVVWLLEKLA